MPQTTYSPSAADAFRFYLWAAAVAARTDLTATQKLVAHALARCANTRTGQCNPSRKLLAAAIGTTRPKTISDATTALADAGCLRVEHGKGNRASYVLLETGAVTPVQKGALAPEVGREGARLEGRSGALPRENYEENYEEKRGAPDGAHPRSPSDDPATERADAIAALHRKLVAAETGTKPTGRPLTAKDRAAAIDLAGLLEADDWPRQLDLAMRVGLAGNDFMRGRVVTLSGLAQHLNELLARAKRSESGPPPAAWDADDADDGPGDEVARCANCGEVDCLSPRACALQVQYAADLARPAAATCPATLPTDAQYADHAAPDDDIPF